MLIERNKSNDVELTKCNQERDDHNKLKVADINRISPWTSPYLLFASAAARAAYIGLHVAS